MQILIIIVLVIALCSLWGITEGKKLLTLNENVCSAMNQVVMQQELKQVAYLRNQAEAVESYERMIRTSSLIYNDSAKKLNKALDVFPVKLIAELLGIRRREYIETEMYVS